MRRAGARMLVALCAGGALALLGGCGSSSPGGKTATTVTSSGGSSGPATVRISTTPRYTEASPTEPVRSGLVNVAYRNITIQPDVIRVKLGTIVKWTNYDPVDHNVTSDSGPQHFASGDFGMGGTYEVRLTRLGVIHYLCTIHPATMNGTIEVVR